MLTPSRGWERGWTRCLETSLWFFPSTLIVCETHFFQPRLGKRSRCRCHIGWLYRMITSKCSSYGNFSETVQSSGCIGFGPGPCESEAGVLRFWVFCKPRRPDVGKATQRNLETSLSLRGWGKSFFILTGSIPRRGYWASRTNHVRLRADFSHIKEPTRSIEERRSSFSLAILITHSQKDVYCRAILIHSLFKPPRNYLWNPLTLPYKYLRCWKNKLNYSGNKFAFQKAMVQV